MLLVILTSLAIRSFGVGHGLEGLLSDLFATMLAMVIFLVVFERPRERTRRAGILLRVVAIGWARHLLLGCLDKSDVFDRAIGDFPRVYADQIASDHVRPRLERKFAVWSLLPA